MHGARPNTRVRAWPFARRRAGYLCWGCRLKPTAAALPGCAKGPLCSCCWACVSVWQSVRVRVCVCLCVCVRVHVHVRGRALKKQHQMHASPARRTTDRGEQVGHVTTAVEDAVGLAAGPAMQIANRAVSSLFCNTTNHYLPPTTANTQPKTSPPPPLLLLPSYHCPGTSHVPPP